MDGKIFILAGVRSNSCNGQSVITPKAFKWMDEAISEGIGDLINWLDDHGVIDGDTDTGNVMCSRLYPEGTFDELTVQEMPLDEYGNLTVPALREYLDTRTVTNFYAATGNEDYISIEIHETEVIG